MFLAEAPGEQCRLGIAVGGTGMELSVDIDSLVSGPMLCT